MELLPLAIALPLGMGFLLPLVPKKGVRVADVLANATTLGLIAIAVALAGRTEVYRMGGWDPPVGINLVLDGLSWIMLLMVGVVSFAGTLFSARYMDRYTARSRYYGLFMLMVAGMNTAVLTGDMFNLYVFIEVAAIASYALVAFGCRQEELEAAFKYAVLGSIASAFILLGIATVYCLFGTVNMAHLSSKMADGAGRGAALLALTLFVAGFGLKAAVVPFHAWLPDAHPSAPAPISAMLSGVLIKAIGVYALLRVTFTVFGITAQIAEALMLLGTLSMVLGVLMAIVQWDFKRLLAYHSVSQIGYVILGIGAGGAVLAAGGSPVVAALGFAGGLFHLLNHAVFKSLLFLTAGAVEYNTGTRELKEMGGLRGPMPVTAGTSLVASMSIAGVPPFNGFFSKLLIIFACARAGYYGYAGWAVLVSVITLASFMKVQKYAFFGKLRQRWRSLREVPATMRTAMVLLAVLCLAMSGLMLPRVREAVLGRAGGNLADRAGYVQRVLGPGPLADSAEGTQTVER
ncbi:MAG: complex I subunit 5 family protein [Planctomycetota bacterium]